MTTVIDCKPTALEVADRADVPLALPWDAIARVEVARRHDLRWPALAAGLAGGLWLGLKMEPLEEEGPCTSSGGFGVSCPLSDRGQMIFLGLSIGAVAGYFGGMLIKFDRWELVPTLGGQASLHVRVAF